MQKLWSSKKDEDKEIVAGVENVEEEDLKSNATLFGTLTSIFTKKDTIEAEAESKMEEPVEDADIHAEKQTEKVDQENESKKHVRQPSLLETVSAMLFRTSASASAENSDEESASQGTSCILVFFTCSNNLRARERVLISAQTFEIHLNSAKM